jgi:histidinol-phosphate/aromatic aminotransferase/cobyric acid decarboxylase-like protein
MTTDTATGAATSNPPPALASGRVVLGLASDHDRQAIYRLRHEVYARELGQHAANPARSLRDSLDDWNIYLVAKIGDHIAGFISITPPGPGIYSIDKYTSREALPFAFDNRLYEIRLLTVLRPHRGGELALLLMFAAFRWVEAHGGTRVVAIGRREVVEMYLRAGLEPVGITVRSGAVTYDFLQASTESLRERLTTFGGLMQRLESNTDWRLAFPFRKPVDCFHGGQFFTAIGSQFDDLARSERIINADVLDAWFPPAPTVLAELQAWLPWILRTSPPTQCDGLVETIAATRGVSPDTILPGAGSSDLIFRALRLWLNRHSSALILDPTYGEYAHVLEQVIGCTVDRLTLCGRDDYALDLDRLEAALADDYDLVILVNPNSPTGQHAARPNLEAVLRQAPACTRIWLDETYVEYAGPGQSLERFAAHSENVIVCKSMSKVYALSGARVAYLCAGPAQLEELRSITPPWVVSFPAQLAAVRALQESDYYALRYEETRRLRAQLVEWLKELGFKVNAGIANFILAHLPSSGPIAAQVVRRCRKQGVYLRDAAPMGSQLGEHALRIAVKDAQANRRIVEVLAYVLRSSRS